MTAPRAPWLDPTAGARARFENPGGMWMPEQIAAQSATLKAMGFQLDAASFTHLGTFPLGAVVSLGGCSASFVSGDGLVVTNHHCATSALQYSSTPEQNLIRDGYLARARADERWNGPTARVYVTQQIRDVSAEVVRGLDALSDDIVRFRTVEDRTKRLIADCERGRPGIRCSMASYFGGGQFRVIEQLEIRDVRLVYVPSASIGNYGGEVDNWRWPRHTGDFAFFRAYVGPDGKPADHADANVPYHPPQHLRLASSALRAGDFVMVAGYPGQTSRLRTAAEVEQAVTWSFPHGIATMEELIGVAERVRQTSADLAIKAAPLIRGLNNWLTKTRGMLEGLVRGGLLARRKQIDAEIRAEIEAAGQVEGRDLFERLDAIDRERIRHREHDAALGETLQYVRLLGAASTIVRMAEERAKPDEARDPAYQARNWQRLEQAQTALAKSYDRALDRALLHVTLERALRLPKSEQPETVKAILGTTPNASEIDARIDRLYATTQLENAARRVALLRASTDELRASRDPLIQLALELRPAQKTVEERDHAVEGALVLLRPRYVEWLRRRAGGALAPDANGTLRITYGTVRSYRPAPDAPPVASFTRLAEVVRKHTGRDPFDAPASLLTAADRVQRAVASSRVATPYADAALGDVPVDFLSDLDITNGNSGSPTLNARGELVGLAFDGNIEAVASDWLFTPAQTRTIHVDLRYMLWVMDEVDHATGVLRELGVTPAAPDAPR